MNRIERHLDGQRLLDIPDLLAGYGGPVMNPTPGPAIHGRGFGRSGSFVERDGRLGEVISLFHDDRGNMRAEIRYFNGEPWPIEPLAAYLRSI